MPSATVQAKMRANDDVNFDLFSCEICQLHFGKSFYTRMSTSICFPVQIYNLTQQFVVHYGLQRYDRSFVFDSVQKFTHRLFQFTITTIVRQQACGDLGLRVDGVVPNPTNLFRVSYGGGSVQFNGAFYMQSPNIK